MTLIRRATRADAATITDFNRAMALETEGLRLDAERSAAGVIRLLEDPALGFYLVAEQAGRVMGSLMVTTEWSDWRNASFWWIQSVFIRPEARRSGVFRALYAHLEAMAADDPGVCGFRLYVEEENRNAQATYRSLGMSQTHYQLFEALKPGIAWFAKPGAD